MNILLINPCLRMDNPRKYFPIGLGYIATAIENAGYEFTIYDIDAHRYTNSEIILYLKKNSFDIIAFGCLVTHYKWAKWLMETIKKISPSSTIIIGNSIASSIPDILFQNTKVDIAVIGEGDITIINILKRLEKEKSIEDIKGIYYRNDDSIIKNPEQNTIKDIDTLPFVNRDLFDIDEYLKASKYSVHQSYTFNRNKIRTLNINTARGCVFNCSFCYHVFKKYRHRSAESIINEIKILKEKYEINCVQFWDDLSFINKKFINEFCDKVIDTELNIAWAGTTLAGVFTENDINLAKKMKQAGCIALGYSIESSCPEILKLMNKPITMKKFSETHRVLQKAKIATTTSLIFGYPIETEKTINDTINFCIKEKVVPSAGFLVPLPGTSIYDYAVENNHIKDEEKYLLTIGDRQDFRINLTKIPSEKFENIVKEGVRKIQLVADIHIKGDNPLKTFQKRTIDKNER